MDEKSVVIDENNKKDVMYDLYMKLKGGSMKEVHKFASQQNVVNYFKENSMEAIPRLTVILEEDFCTVPVESSIENLLKTIASVANIKEVTLVLLEEVEIVRSQKHLSILVKPLQVLLSRVYSNVNSKVFTWILETLYSHLQLHNISNNDSVEGLERQLFEGDPLIQDVIKSLSSITECVEFAYQKLIQDQLHWNSRDPKLYFVNYLIRFFEKPFLQLEFHQDALEPKSTSYTFCLKYTEMITKINPNIYKLLSLVLPKPNKLNNDQKVCSNDNDSTDSELSQLALATFFCFIISQDLNIPSVPLVHSPIYIYFSCVPCCVHLLTEKNTQVVYKGLKLLNSILFKIENDSLPSASLDAPNHYELFQSLTKIMSFCENKECRTMALSSSKCFYQKFCSDGRLKLVSTILKNVFHSGIQGVFIHELKESINAAFPLVNHSKVPVCHDQYNWSKVEPVLLLVCTLPNAEKTDLLEWSDKIMATLNLLIFLSLKSIYDKKNLHILSSTYLDELSEGLRLSKGYYNLKLKEYDDQHQRKLTKVSINVGNEHLPNLPPDQEKEVIKSALNYFDMMESVLVRTTKVLTLNQKTIKT